MTIGKLSAPPAVAIALLSLVTTVCWAAGQPVKLKPGMNAPALPPQADLLLDPGGGLGIEQVMQADGRFSSNAGSRINLGLDAPVIWLRFTLLNAGRQPGSWVLSLNRALLHIVEVHLVAPGDRQLLLSSERPGDIQKSYARFGTLAVMLALPPGAERMLYIRYQGNASNLLPTIETVESFEARRQRLHHIYVAVLAGVLTLSLFSAVTFGATGLRPYLYFVFGQLALLAYVSHLAGYTTVYLWPGQPELGSPMAALSFTAYTVLLLLFARSLFATRERARRLDIWLFGLVGLGLVHLALELADVVLGLSARSFLNGLSVLIGMTGWATLPAIAVLATVRWSRRYAPVAVAWVPAAAIVFYTAASLLGHVPTLPYFVELYAGLAFYEAVLLALVLALHVRDLRRQSFEAVRQQLSESRRSERLARQNAAALLELAEKQRMLQAAGHDSRQMLHSLRHFAAGLSETAGPERLEEARRSIGRLADHLDEILATTIDAGHSGGIDDRLVAFDAMPAAAILDPMRLIHERSAMAKGLRFRSRADGPQVVADRALVMRIVSNLVSNAVKYAASGGVLLACRSIGSHVRLQVWDTGRGLTSAQLARLLGGPFRQQRFAQDEAGLGTGLASARALADRIGGELRACSRPGHGSLFELVLPMPTTPFGCNRGIAIVSSDPGFRRQLDALAADLDIADVLRAANLLATGGCGELSPILLIDADENEASVFEGLTQDGLGERAILVTFDRSAERRTQLARYCDTVLYKPVTIGALRLALSRIGG